MRFAESFAERKTKLIARTEKKGGDKKTIKYVAMHRVFTSEVYEISRYIAHRCYRFSITARRWVLLNINNSIRISPGKRLAARVGVYRVSFGKYVAVI